VKLTAVQVQTFLTEHLHRPVSGVIPLSGGEWSQAFGFQETNLDYVIRFGHHKNDYLIDQYAVHYATAKLPIPKVLEIGEAFDGYFAISERAFGIMIDDLNKDAMERVLPSLFATMDAIRETDVSHTTGFGQMEANGNGTYNSWSKYLLNVNKDIPSMKIHGWKEGLASSPVGLQPFEEGYSALKRLTRDLPEIRSLVHNDLLNFNVLVNNDEVSAVIDWANAFYGDFLYDLAQFTFWGPLHEPVKHIDWGQEARAHYKLIGLEIPQFEQRLMCCMINMGLGAMCYFGYKKNWEYLKPVVQRTLQLAKS
jgi:hygromycin-B 4-O-kinase